MGTIRREFEKVMQRGREDAARFLTEAADTLRWTDGFENRDCDAEFQRHFDTLFSSASSAAERDAARAEIDKLLTALEASGAGCREST